MAVTKGKYIRLHVLLLKDEYRELRDHTRDHGWTLAWFVRNAITRCLRDGKLIEVFLHEER